MPTNLRAKTVESRYKSYITATELPTKDDLTVYVNALDELNKLDSTPPTPGNSVPELYAALLPKLHLLVYSHPQYYESLYRPLLRFETVIN